MRPISHHDGVGRMEGGGIVERAGVNGELCSDAVFAAEQKAAARRAEIANPRAPRAQEFSRLPCRHSPGTIPVGRS